METIHKWNSTSKQRQTANNWWMSLARTSLKVASPLNLCFTGNFQRSDEREQVTPLSGVPQLIYINLCKSNISARYRFMGSAQRVSEYIGSSYRRFFLSLSSWCIKSSAHAVHSYRGNSRHAVAWHKSIRAKKSHTLAEPVEKKKPPQASLDLVAKSR